MATTKGAATAALGSSLARPTLRAGASFAVRQHASFFSSKAASPLVSLISSTSSPARKTFAPAATATRPRWYSAGDGASVPGSKRWEFDEIKNQLEKSENADIVFVDVREPAELLDTGKIPGAINIPITSAVQSFHVSDADFEDMYGFERPAKEKTLVFYCKAGVRARAAAGLAQHAGWENIGEYPGSWLDWETHQGPVEKVKGGN